MAADVVSRTFAHLQRRRGIVIAIFAVLVPLAAIVAGRIPNRGAIEQLIVPSDPDVVATRAFHRVFAEPQLALIVIEARDPWSAPAIARVDRAARVVAAVPHVRAFSLLDALRRARPGATPAELRALALGTDFFRRQGLVGDDFITVVANLDVANPGERDVALAGIDRALAAAAVAPVREVGAPYVDSWLEQRWSAEAGRAFPAFGVLVVIVTLFLYRSARTLLAILLSLGSAVALALAAGAACGFSFTIVSALVPLTVMVNTLATLNYIHLRFVDQPEGTTVAEHQLVALRNKVKPVTASTIAAALGFAALAVSPIRPIREMGLWTALGLVVAWVVALTLFPALQLALRTPTGRRVAVRSAAYDRIARAIPVVTYRYRYAFVGTALALCAAGVVAIATMTVEVDPLANIDHHSAIYRDTRWFRDHVMASDVARVWIHLPRATATDPAVLAAVDRLQRELALLPDVTGVTGPTTLSHLRSYFAGRGWSLPAGTGAFADVEQLILTEPELRAFIDPDGLADLQLVVLVRKGDSAGYAAVERGVRAIWDSVRADAPALAGARMDVVGEALLEAKVGASLVPTLAQSLVITVVLILLVFLVVTRSATERLLAMIPSAFALLATFLGLRLLGGTLNIATIIIATTVLGTTENDQLHFFHHMHERAGAPLEERLRHTLAVSGKAIGFATVIYACGFLAFSMSSFPPLRQFGLVTAAAFVLAMIADFTMLPAAMWLVSREQPAAMKTVTSGHHMGRGSSATPAGAPCAPSPYSECSPRRPRPRRNHR
ncbi:MAG TPA: MMPL family transporter [Kofleriaceae bacterium]|nr:MMPL family transporter [Kofleriaceae bacterium]